MNFELRKLVLLTTNSLRPLSFANTSMEKIYVFFTLFSIPNSNDASNMLESPSSSVGSLDLTSPRMCAGGDNNCGFYVTMTPLNSNLKISVS